MKKTIKLTDLEEVIRKMPKRFVETRDVSPYGTSIELDEYVKPSSIMYYVNRFIKEQTKK